MRACNVRYGCDTDSHSVCAKVGGGDSCRGAGRPAGAPWPRPAAARRWRWRGSPWPPWPPSLRRRGVSRQACVAVVPQDWRAAARLPPCVSRLAGGPAGGGPLRPAPAPEAKTGRPRWVEPPFLGLTPPTTCVPYWIACRAVRGSTGRQGGQLTMLRSSRGQCRARAPLLTPAAHARSRPPAAATRPALPALPCPRLLRMEGSVLAGEPLHDDLCVLIHKHGGVVGLRGGG